MLMIMIMQSGTSPLLPQRLLKLTKLFFTNFKDGARSPQKDAMEPWSPTILSLGARSPIKYALETRSPKPLRGPLL